MNRLTAKLTATEGYRTQSSDTSIEADLLDFYKLRQQSVTERVAYAADLMAKMYAFSLQCLSQQFAHLSPADFARKVAEAWLQEDCPPGYAPRYAPRGNEMSWIQNSPELAVRLHGLFETLGIPYFIVGGVAAIAYGDPRTTRDLDVVVEVSAQNISALIAALEQAGFYVAGGGDSSDDSSVQPASLQLTHKDTIARADLMIARNDSYSKVQFERRRQYAFPGSVEVYLAAPEDIVIGKLRWGFHSRSEKQQADVLAIFKVQQGDLDYQYLYSWATKFAIAELVEDLTIAAGVREFANQQWAQQIFPVAQKIFNTAQIAGHTISSGSEYIALGAAYDLVLNSQTQSFTIMGSADGSQVAQFGEGGQCLAAKPSLSDRIEWQKICR
jgi:hypothetical protein